MRSLLWHPALDVTPVFLASWSPYIHGCFIMNFKGFIGKYHLTFALPRPMGDYVLVETGHHLLSLGVCVSRKLEAETEPKPKPWRPDLG